MNINYTPTDYAAVRRYVDPVLIASDLPDSVIAEDAYIGAAERWVITLIPNADDAVGGDLAAIKNAVLFYAASIILSTSPVIRMGRMSEQNFQIENGDTIRRIDYLREMAVKMLQGVSIKPPRQRRNVTFFTKALARPRTW